MSVRSLISMGAGVLALAAACGGSDESGLFEGSGGASGAAGSGGTGTGGSGTGGSAGMVGSGGSGVGGAAGSGVATGGTGGTGLPTGGTGGTSPTTGGTGGLLPDAGNDVTVMDAPGPTDVMGNEGNDPIACPPTEPVVGTPCNILINMTSCQYGPLRNCFCFIATWSCVP